MSFQKDPQAVLDYQFDWSAWLEDTETITAFTVVATGVTVDSSSQAAGVVTVWLSGGTNGTTATVQCEVVTSAGRTDQRTITVSVRDR